MGSSKKKMLITGASGLLGSNLAYYFKYKYDIEGWYSSHKVVIDGIKMRKVDIISGKALDKIIEEAAPDIIIHCASLTDVDFCQSHRSLTKLVNIDGTRRLTQAAKGLEVKLIYISTDSVYDGSKGNFNEEDPVNPCNYYGQSKYEGEEAVREKENSLMLRTNIFGWNVQEKDSIAEWVLHQLIKHNAIKGFKDAHFSSIYTFEFARILEEAIKKGLKGLYNCGSRTSLSKYEFACTLAERFKLDKSLVEPVNIDDFPFVAKRGKNLSLDSSKLSYDLGVELPTIEESLDAFLHDYQKDLPGKIRDKQSNGESYPKLSNIPYGRQSLDDDDIASVVDVLKSSNLTQGESISSFEKSLCNYTGSQFAVAFNSGTSALHAAALAAGVSEGGEVITSPNTFVASANCAVYCGGKPVFADIDNDTYNIDPDKIDKKISSKTKCVIPVHFAGQSCEMERIAHIVKEKEKESGHKIYIIEDGCHALGSSYKQSQVGSGTYSDMTVMSFHPVKHITTGEGGAVLTNDKDLFNRLKSFRSHGIIGDAEEFKYTEEAHSSSGEVNPWYYEQQRLGYNYRITDIQCALGLSQIKKLPSFMKKRREIVNRYNKAFGGKDSIKVPTEILDCMSNWHLYVLSIDFFQLGIERSHFMLELKRKGIQTQVHYIPVHTQPYYRENFGTDWGDCPNSEEYYKKCISIPLYPTMTDLDVKKVIDEVLLLVNIPQKGR